jgi:uncharacterized YccA/Bax inhibitor family protein
VANPILNDKALDQAAKRSGWGAPEPTTTWNPPVTDGPVTAWRPDGSGGSHMTVAGTASATGVLMVLLLVAAYFGWQTADSSDASGFPPVAMIGVLVGFVAVLVSSFKPKLARFLAPVYALAEGFFLGAVSQAFNSVDRYEGIVIQAVGATLGVFAVMLFLYRTQVIKVTAKFRRIVMGATLGVMLFYGVSMLMRLFGVNISFFDNANAIGILFSLFVAGLAAFNLALDFDFIEKGAANKLPKHMEWFAALGLLVTLVWLYLEVLRLLAKLRDR